jgi:hypothetical protein
MGENEVVATCQFLVVQARSEGKPFRRTFWIGDYSCRRNDGAAAE